MNLSCTPVSSTVSIRSNAARERSQRSFKRLRCRDSSSIREFIFLTLSGEKGGLTKESLSIPFSMESFS